MKPKKYYPIFVVQDEGANFYKVFTKQPMRSLNGKWDGLGLLATLPTKNIPDKIKEGVSKNKIYVCGLEIQTSIIDGVMKKYIQFVDITITISKKSCN